jgi:hypothetical protein
MFYQREDSMKKRDRPFISDRTITRRSLLDWLGKATVLALGGDIMAACASSKPVIFNLDGESEGGGDPAGGEPDAAQDPVPEPAPDSAGDASDGDAGDAGDAFEFPFEPGSGDQEVYDGWGERTVDRQNIESILSTWRLKVDGLVENPFEIDFAELIALPRQDQVTDFHCVEGWSIYDVPWNGVHLSRIVERARPLGSAAYVAFHTIDEKYNESLPMAVALEPRTLLGYGIGGYTLPLRHGFPLRLVVPRLLAYKSAKYVDRIEFTDRPLYGFWVEAGYPYEAEVPESRLREGKY